MDNGHVVVVSVSVGWCAVPCRVHPCTRRRSLTMNCRRRRRPWQHQARKHQLPARHAKQRFPSGSGSGSAAPERVLLLTCIVSVKAAV